jgi:membrane-associated phospholipid phosphatase
MRNVNGSAGLGPDEHLLADALATTRQLKARSPVEVSLRPGLDSKSQRGYRLGSQGRLENEMTRTFKFWAGGLLLVTLFALISVTWFDRPVATWVHNLFGSPHFGRMARSPGQSIPLISAVAFVIYGFAAILGRQFSKVETAALMCTVSLLATEVTKNQLKFVFGRTWPDSWAPGIVSFIHDNQFGFHFFHSGQSYGSFPSGHAAAVAAVMSVLWIMFPKLRAGWVICMAAADLGLVLLNLHFISDVVVGTFVGSSVGLFTITLWSAAGRPDSLGLASAQRDRL